ncbi:transglycosylase SLT domain-containing protein [Cupriavidus numazuensis]|uniref:Membrane-bound lytic murein transglycosylase F n=1 Tax=Cupriavidus numazuensis TaxID=221992 RepID=A0ABM8TAW2_9BURK|nr:transglycosylase SLT domain-containing protein [Cupriavidus numazuensis]CAG2132427.1 Membrane-bound lytic murein transglycosylase F [Cupriavidus numazuensis]
MSTRASHRRKESPPPTRLGMRGCAVVALSVIVGLMLLAATLAASAQIPPAAHQYRQAIARETAFRFGATGPVPVIAAQIMQESKFNPLARSQVGAQGLMQFMPATATWAGQAGVDGPVQPLNPQWSIRAGVWYDRWLYDRVKTAATECDRWAFVLSSYNGGLGYVYKRQKLSAAPGSWPVTGQINPGIHPANQRENADYPLQILGRWQPLFTTWGRPVRFPC